MPKRTDIKKILIIGSGPIVIGQGSEFDYAGSQVCKTLREEGYEVLVVDSNPATIMSEPNIADKTYIEPLTPDSITKIIEKEQPDALLATVGGQTALNLTMLLDKAGVLMQYGVQVLGADALAISKSEDRQSFKETMQSIGVRVPRSGIAASIEDGMQVIKELGFPVVLKPSYTMSGTGSAVAYNVEEFVGMLTLALETSPIHRILIEESVLGWKEIEFEVVRDSADNTAVVTSLESIDPTGVHTGDSAVVIPAQTLSAADMKKLSDLASKIARAIGVVGGINIQFAVESKSGEIVAIEANPRAGRSSALASKAIGLPIASVAAKLAVGYVLSEIDAEFKQNGCCVKLPRFTFEKFPDADPALGVSMKAVGEAVAIGKNFKEALQKCIRSLDNGRYGLGSDGKDPEKERRNPEVIIEKIARPNADRLFFLRYAVESGMSEQDISELSGIDSWFIENIRELVEFEGKLAGKSLVSVSSDVLHQAKALGYSDIQLAALLETDEEQVRMRRKVLGIEGAFCDTGEPCFYSTYAEVSDTSAPSSGKKVIILGSGPNRIGQGAEFDYCCVKGLEAAREENYQSIMINCNPAAASTDVELSDKFYLEPLILENVLRVIDREKPDGVIVQLGGWTALNLSIALKKVKVQILGTSVESINRTRDKRLLRDMIRKLNLQQTANDVAGSIDEALSKAKKIGYPMIVRPSHTVGGRSVDIVYDDDSLVAFLESATKGSASYPVLLSKFIEDATEVGVDAVSDGETTLICGVMEHIEQAGIHSGDSACSLPPYSLSASVVDEIKRQTRLIAEELTIHGLINVQYAVKDGDVYVLNVNPFASRTLPFVSKATGVAWAKVAGKIMLGKTLKEQGISEEIVPKYMAVKEAVFPFMRLPGVDVALGPEMKSTGEVMGINANFGSAYIKAQTAAGQDLPESGTVFVSVADRDKADIVEIGKKLRELGFDIVATKGTATALKEAGVDAKLVAKIGEGRPDATDLIKNNAVDLIINTPSGKKPRRAEISIRSAIVARGIPIVTTIAGAKATLFGMETVRNHGMTVRSLRD